MSRAHHRSIPPSTSWEFLSWASATARQLIAEQLGGTVGRGMRGEYGRAKLTRISGSESTLLHSGIPDVQEVWMSHFDAVTEPPPGFVATASTPDAPVAAVEDPSRKIWGVQYHPEVVHTPFGMACWSSSSIAWRLPAGVDALASISRRADRCRRAQVGSGRATRRPQPRWPASTRLSPACGDGQSRRRAAAHLHLRRHGRCDLNESDQVVETFSDGTWASS